jgi:hypothetical protein
VPAPATSGGHPDRFARCRLRTSERPRASGDRVIYSAANETGDLGTGIFEVGLDVRAYIVDGLRRVVRLAW